MTPNQRPPLPKNPRPIVAIGAGAIVEHAHWVAYRIAGFPVFGVFDVDHDRASRLAEQFGVQRVFSTLTEAIAEAPSDAVFDIAVPAAALDAVLTALPNGRAALVQKPFGETLAHANRLAAIAQQKNLLVAVNFQLRFAPYALGARDLVETGAIGEITEIDVKVNVETPWHLWDFLERAPRMEIVYHSIHYLDLIRSFLGEPARVLASTIKHPASPNLHSSRSAIILEYHDMLRATVNTNHGHRFGPKHQESYVRVEGTAGCIKFQMGLNMNYPAGAPDYLEVFTQGSWQTIVLEGSWFPHAFIGTMASLMRRLEDPDTEMPTEMSDALLTMELVEKCYGS